MNNKKILIVLAVLAVILFLLLVFMLWNEYEKEKYMPDEIPTSDEEFFDANKAVEQVRRVDIKSNYNVVKNIIEKYFSCFDNEYINQVTEANASFKLLDMLDEEYISYSSLTESNVLNTNEKLDSFNVIIEDMYVSERTENLYIYFVYGYIHTEGNNKNFKLAVKVDKHNEAFSIYGEEYVNAKFSNIYDGCEIEYSGNNEISKKIFNNYQFKNVTTQVYAMELFNLCKYYLQHDNEKLYEILDESYKATFNGYQDFANMLNSEKELLQNIVYDSYIKNNLEDGKVEYTLMDADRKVKIILKEIASYKFTFKMEII